MTTRNNIPTPTKIVCWFLIMITIMLLISCGARKTNHQKEVTKEVASVEVAIVDKSKVETTTDQNIKIIDSSKSDEITITPFDNTKEMVVEGKKYFNTVLKRKKVNTNKVIEAKEKVNVIASNDVKTNVKAKTEKRNKVDLKQTKKIGFNFGNFIMWLLIIACGFGGLYWWFYIRNKKQQNT